MGMCFHRNKRRTRALLAIDESRDAFSPLPQVWHVESADSNGQYLPSSLIITLLPALHQRLVSSAIKRAINIVLDYASLG